MSEDDETKQLLREIREIMLRDEGRSDAWMSECRQMHSENRRLYERSLQLTRRNLVPTALALVISLATIALVALLMTYGQGR